MLFSNKSGCQWTRETIRKRYVWTRIFLLTKNSFGFQIKTNYLWRALNAKIAEKYISNNTSCSIMKLFLLCWILKCSIQLCKKINPLNLYIAFLKSTLPNNLLFSSTTGKIDDQIFINKNVSAPGVLRFHPYEPYLAVADRGGVRYAFFCACQGWG